MRNSSLALKSIFLLFCMLTLGLQGCDRGTFLRSEKKILQLLEHKWDLVLLASNQQHEEWSFSDGKVVLHRFKDNGDLVMADTGAYVLDTGFSNDFLKISGFTAGNVFFNTTWQIIDLDEKFMTIANNRENTSGLQLKEFVRLD